MHTTQDLAEDINRTAFDISASVAAHKAASARCFRVNVIQQVARVFATTTALTVMVLVYEHFDTGFFHLETEIFCVGIMAFTLLLHTVMSRPDYYKHSMAAAQLGTLERECGELAARLEIANCDVDDVGFVYEQIQEDRAYIEFVAPSISVTTADMWKSFFMGHS